MVQLFLSERKKAFEPAAANAGLCNRWRTGTDRNIRRKYSALENSMKQYIDSSFLAGKNQQEQKEVIQKLISDIAHQTLTPISNLKIYGEILSEVSNENQDEIATILEQTEKLDF